MAKKNKLSTDFKATLDKEAWDTLCSPMEYKIVNASTAYQLGIVPTGMTDVNCVIVGASGSTDNTIMYFANYMRVDKTEIDQEPYIELYENGSTVPILHGIIHHADFSGRTERLGSSELAKIAASGSTADIQFTAKPSNSFGTLEDLRTEGKITGFEFAYGHGIKKKPQF